MYNKFTTSDGITYYVLIKPKQLGWTAKQHRLARRSLVIGRSIAIMLAGLMAILIAQSLGGK